MGWHDALSLIAQYIRALNDDFVWCTQMSQACHLWQALLLPPVHVFPKWHPHCESVKIKSEYELLWIKASAHSIKECAKRCGTLIVPLRRLLTYRTDNWWKYINYWKLLRHTFVINNNVQGCLIYPFYIDHSINSFNDKKNCFFGISAGKDHLLYPSWKQ